MGKVLLTTLKGRNCENKTPRLLINFKENTGLCICLQTVLNMHQIENLKKKHF